MEQIKEVRLAGMLQASVKARYRHLPHARRPPGQWRLCQPRPNPVERCPGASFRETHFSGVEDRLSSPYVETAPVRRRQAWKSLGEPKSASNDRKKN
jgi:hypothetical protein